MIKLEEGTYYCHCGIPMEINSKAKPDHYKERILYHYICNNKNCFNYGKYEGFWSDKPAEEKQLKLF